MRKNPELKNMPTSILHAIVNRLGNKNAVRLHAAGLKSIHHVTNSRASEAYPKKYSAAEKNATDPLCLAILKLRRATGNSLLETNNRIRRLVDSGAPVASHHIDTFISIGYFALPRARFLHTLKALRQHAEPTHLATTFATPTNYQKWKLRHLKNLESLKIPVGGKALGSIFLASMINNAIPDTHQLDMLKYRLMNNVDAGMISIAKSFGQMFGWKVMKSNNNSNTDNSNNNTNIYYIDLAILTWWLRWLEPFYAYADQKSAYALLMCLLEFLNQCRDVACLNTTTVKATEFLASLALLMHRVSKIDLTMLLGSFLYQWLSVKLDGFERKTLRFGDMYIENPALYFKVINMLVRKGARVSGAVHLLGLPTVGESWLKYFSVSGQRMKPLAHWIEEQHCPAATKSIIPFLNVDKVKDPRTLTQLLRYVA